MAFAPMGPEASFFEVLDRHRASLLAELRRAGGEPPCGGTRLASRFEDSVGLQMVSHCTTRKIKSDSPKSVQKFALILKILSTIYKLVQSNTYATKRDIYYTDSQLFGNQTVVDNIISDISCMLKMPRRSLHILSTSKGLIAGNLRYIEEDGTKVNCTGRATAIAVPSNIQGIRNLITDAKFVLIVEKDATFQRLLDDNFCNKMSPCIMVTLNIPKDSLIPLTKRDQMKLDSILKRPYVTCQPFWRKE
uniref:DNA topoisomerase (ATP-hydrolyzing) n=1 Tax=Propithecus coquereli TaxID=379532 RepID=A0A2K6G234_PROCO